MTVSIGWMCKNMAVSIGWMCKNMAVSIGWMCKNMAVSIGWMCKNMAVSIGWTLRINCIKNMADPNDISKLCISSLKSIWCVSRFIDVSIVCMSIQCC